MFRAKVAGTLWHITLFGNKNPQHLLSVVWIAHDNWPSLASFEPFVLS